jgi:phosphoribosylformylglycinamidine synthase
MANVMRVFVEKKPGFDVEAGHILSDLRDTLGLSELTSLRLFNRYDIEGLTGEEFELAAKNVLSEINVDNLYPELELEGKWHIFACEYLPGQYDQRADSAAQCIALLTGGERPVVQTARIFALEGNISDDTFDRIKSYLINPVESRIASMDKPQSLDIRAEKPADIKIIDRFINMNPDEIAQLHKNMSLAMSVADLEFCQNYFAQEEGRNPTFTEIRVIDTYWSDHCRHTTFLTQLEGFEVEGGRLSKPIEDAWNEYNTTRARVYGELQKKITLMDIATIGTKLIKKRGLASDIDESDEINACSINAEIDVCGEKEPWLIQFKNETHNHPTEIEPFGGAATCLGGAIRDPLSGRAYVYQAMRVTGSGNPLTPFEKTLEGKLPQKKITLGAAQGYSSYGNQIGLATGQVSELYDEGYVAKRMEIGAVIGALPKKNVRRETPRAGDMVVLLGGRTGRDGCGGATGSSKAHDTSSIETCGAEVQKGNPPTERKLQRLFRNSEAAHMIKRCNDFGAGGVCVAIGELAEGLKIELDSVPKKYEGLDGTELAISESQERMAVVLDPWDVKRFFELSHEENLEATVVAMVTNEPRLVMNWRGKTIVNISREFLNTNGVTQKANVRIRSVNANKNYRAEVPKELENLEDIDALRANLKRIEVCSQKGLSERFDSSIGASTVLMPFAGKYQLTPEDAMVAKVPVPGGKTDSATAMSYGFIPGLSRWSPFHGAVYAVTQALAKLAAVGADPFRSRLTMQEYFERLNDVPERWGKPVAALLGALTAQLNYNVPAIGGKDSMSGSFNELDVPPTLVCFAVSMTKASLTGSAAFKGNRSRVVMLPLPVDSETSLPDWEKVIHLYTKVSSMVRSSQITAASVIHEGGAAAAVCRMAFGEGKGFKFRKGLIKETLFAPFCGSFVVELAENTNLGELDYIELGTTCDDGLFELSGKSISVFDLISDWTGTLESVFPTNSNKTARMWTIPPYKTRSNSAPSIKTAVPRVIIPVFPGTNCEYDSARAFEDAGARAEIFVFKNLTPKDIDESIEALARAIDNSQIIMLPGGFSAGDEPDGSGKFIATTLKNSRVCDAVNRLLKQRDGLILGICNGFQALIKTGLVPYGEIVDLKPGDPTLTFNTIGRHVSQMVYTRITSIKSPWLAGVNEGDIHAVPVSHGEGRFVADDKTIALLSQNGQIATQYVDLLNIPCAEMPYNPNGSVCAVEGITSPDGRVFGKMAHSERKGLDLYKNIPYNKNQKIFESGIKYYK